MDFYSRMKLPINCSFKLIKKPNNKNNDNDENPLYQTDEKRRKYLEQLINKKQRKEYLVDSVLPVCDGIIDAHNMLTFSDINQSSLKSTFLDTMLDNNKSIIYGSLICGVYEVFNQCRVCWKKRKTRNIVKGMNRGYLDRLIVDYIIPTNEKENMCLTSSLKNVDEYDKIEDAKILEKVLEKYRLSYSHIFFDSFYQIWQTTLSCVMISSIKFSLGKGLNNLLKNSVGFAKSIAISSLFVDVGREYLSYLYI